MDTKQKEILDCCKYYDEIMNTGYHRDDFLTEKLIHMYQDYLFEANKEQLQKVIELDKTMYEYISSKPFYRYVQNYYLKENQTVFEDIESLLSIHQHFVEEQLKTINPSKWI